MSADGPEGAGHANRLIHQTSPYLLQHAHNPVDWYPWGEEALQRARDEDKPILLSIGYSACHWCHVMERESFEDPEVAQVMNELFVCIKVDREERPDLDKIYQLAHQMLTQRAGGWPLNVFLMPDDHTPFFGGTYFPREPRHGMPAFTDILRRVAAYYTDHRTELEQQNASVRGAFDRISADSSHKGGNLGPRVLVDAIGGLSHQFDSVHGGFGQAPKFPHPTNLERLLRHWAASVLAGNEAGNALDMARLSLHAMAGGGIYDQVGGGFCRYAVDEAWMIPHFEKMLYDNGPLQAVYTDAARATGEKVFASTAIGIGEWVLREMQSPDGGYFSTLDADSEGEEGKFYVWDADEIKSLVDDSEWDVLETRYQLRGQPNFEGRWHLHVHQSLDDTASALGIPREHAAELLASAHGKLFAARQTRVRPGRDEKILTSWNGLMIKGMARAGRYFDRADFVQSAEHAMDFVRNTLWRDGRLLATTKDDKAHLNAYLDDYAFLADGVLELLQARWRDGDLEFAIALLEVILKHFEDPENGGFFFTSSDHEQLIHRHKSGTDEAIPSGNGVAAQVLLRAGHLLGEPRYLDAAERTLRSLSGEMEHYPHACGALLHALEEYLTPPQTVVLRGDRSALKSWVDRCLQYYAPRRMTLAIPNDAQDLPGVLAARTPRDGVTAYICSGLSCSEPISDEAAFARELASTEVKPAIADTDSSG